MAIYKEEYVLNGEVTGELLYSKDTPGWVSGFSSQNTWRIKEVFSPTADQSFEVSVRVRTGSSISSPNIQEIFAIGQPLLMRIDAKKLSLAYNTGSWSVVGGYSCSTNTEYLTVLKYHPITTTTNGYTYSAKYLYFEIYNSSGDLLNRSSASLNSRFLNFVGDFAYLGSQESGENWSGSIHNGEDTYIKVDGELWWQPLLEEKIDVSGSVEISKGYYSDGSNKIIMPASTYDFNTLTANQTLGVKNKLFVYTDSTDNVGALITSTTPTGSFKITKDLEHPVYLDPTKNAIAGGELIEPEIRFTSGNAEPWVQPVLTSATSYGTCTDSRNNTGEKQEGWRALDKQSGTDFSPAREGGWWKWVVPDTLTFKAGTSTIEVTSGSPATPMDIQFFADEAATKPLTNVITLPSTVGQVTTAQVINTEVTSTIYITIASHSSWSEINEISFVNVFKGAVEASVSSTKALQYSETQDTTYWIPSEATVSLDSVKATQSVGPANDLYLTTTAGTPTASLSFSDNGAIAGVTTKLPLKQKVYLNNATDKILGIQERPDEIDIKWSSTENYTIVGSPTVTNDYVASDFSDSNYLTSSTAFPSSFSSFDLITKIRLNSYQSYSTLFADSTQQKSFAIRSTNKAFCMYTGSVWMNGSTVIPLNTWYWCRVTYDGSSWIAYTLEDQGYSLETLPSLDSWNREWSSTAGWTQGVIFNIGRDTSSSGRYLNGSIDLLSTKYTADGAEWRPVSRLDGITVSGWSALYSDVTGFTGNTALDFTTPADIAASSLEIPAGYGTYTVYLYYINGDIKCKLAGETVLDKTVFTGYALTVRDGAIQSVSKQGELCAAFTQRGYGRNTRRYLFIPVANLREGSFTTKAASAFYDMSVQGTLPPSNMIASMQNIEYNSNDKTVVMDGNTFDYIGDMMCTLI